MSVTPARPARGAATRERLLLAALEMFTARGFHATTTAQIARRTGVAEGTIYRHFPAKQALYATVCRAVWDRASTLVADGDDPRAPAAVRLERAARGLIAEAVRAPAIIRQLVRPVERSALDDAARKAHERFRASLSGMVAAGKQADLIRPGSADVWAALWFAVVGCACERVVEGDWAPDHPNVGLTIGAAWDMMGREVTAHPSTPAPAPPQVPAPDQAPSPGPARGDGP